MSISNPSYPYVAPRDFQLAVTEPGCPRTATVLTEILLGDLRCRRRWLRHTQRLGGRQPNQAGVAWVLALTLWERGEIPESRRTLPRSLKDRVSRALNGRLVSASTLALFVDAFDLTEEQEQELYAAWSADYADVPAGPEISGLTWMPQ
ncbi:hypothetical protein [Ornithinimicrobium sufpigmenti]|uniref:hypothetical protein n=1 Tax=Ornithinimicrobium sufpigmenti TaxID=2508882 RepID=UPI0010356A4E|nr:MULTISPECIES: hypothetical protein [unclassified Ornithinimicrobium]